MLGLNKPVDEPGAAWPGITIGLFASFADILFGYDTSTISGLQQTDYWQETTDYPSTGRLALIVSILSVAHSLVLFLLATFRTSWVASTASLSRQ